MLMRKWFVLSVVSVAFACLLPLLEGPFQGAQAQTETTFGPETFTRGSTKKATFSRSFTADQSRPYTLTLINGAGDGSLRAKKGIVTLDGTMILGKDVFNKRADRIVVAVNLSQQNDLNFWFKGPEGCFVSVSIDPVPDGLLNDPASSDFDSKQAGIGFPFSVDIDQSNHRAYVSDRYRDSVIEFNIPEASISRWFTDLDGDTALDNGATAGVAFNSNARNVVAINEGATGNGSVAVINLDNGFVNVTTVTSNDGNTSPVYAAVNPANSIAAFTGQYNVNGRRAYFFDTTSRVLSTRNESVSLNAVAFSAGTGEFIFTTSDGGSSPGLFVYSATAPFQRVGRIDSTARAGSVFNKVAVNPETNIAAAVNLGDGSVILFDVAAGRQIARVPIRADNSPNALADIAINPQTNMAVVTSRFTERVIVIDLATGLVAAEMPLPAGTRPLGVSIDHGLNRAVIAENGFASTERNGSILVVQLPSFRER